MTDRIEGEFAEQVAIDDPRYVRDYDDSDGRQGMFRFDRKRGVWVDLDHDRKWDHRRLEP